MPNKLIWKERCVLCDVKHSYQQRPQCNETIYKIDLKFTAFTIKQTDFIMGSSAENLMKVKEFGRKWVKDHIIDEDVTRTKPGSIAYLLFGDKPSVQSTSIKFGHFGEAIAKEMIKANPELELLKCGVQVIDGKTKKKDIDLIWLDKTTNKIYIRELKGNIELDTEKLPATFKKITDDLMPFVKEKYPEYEINVGILNWSVCTRDELSKSKGLTHIKTCEQNGVSTDHWLDFCKLINFEWKKDDYYEYMRDFGKMIEGLEKQ